MSIKQYQDNLRKVEIMSREWQMAVVLGVLGGSMMLPICAQAQREGFEPNWASLNARQSPAWFADAKLGIFIHWGIYSVPAICDTSTYAEWYYWWYKTNSHNGLVRKFHDKWYGKDFAYEDFAPRFKAEFWKPEDWA